MVRLLESTPSLPAGRRRAWPPMREVLVVLLGAMALIAGGAATFVSSNGVGSAGLSASGATLLILVLLGEKIEWLKVGSVEVHLREAALTLTREAARLEALGEAGTAAKLRDEARRLLIQASPAARVYEAMRRTQASTPERILELSQIMIAAREHARIEHPSPDAVREVFLNGSDGERIYALGLMQEEPDATYLESILDAICHSHSAFEQGEALAIALRIAPLLAPGDKIHLVDAVRQQLSPGGHIARSKHRRSLAEQLLTILNGNMP